MQFVSMVNGSNVDFIRYGVGGDGEVGVIFNEGSIDADFRVESDGNAYALFVNGATGTVGIGTNVSGRADEGADILAIQATDGGHSGMTIRSGTTHYGSINFADATTGTGTYQGSIFYLHDANKMVLANAGSDRITILVGGQVLVNTNASLGNGALHIDAGSNVYSIIARASSNGAFALFQKDNGDTIGSIDHTSSATRYLTSSDYRLKENVVTSWDATTRLKKLKPSRFNFIADADTTVDGFLAHEVSSIVPEAISGEKDATEDITNVVLNADDTVFTQDISKADWEKGKLATTDKDGNTVDPIYASDTTWVASKTIPDMQGIDQSKLVPLLVKTVQEQQAVIESLTTRIKALEDA